MAHQSRCRAPRGGRIRPGRSCPIWSCSPPSVSSVCSSPARCSC